MAFGVGDQLKTAARALKAGNLKTTEALCLAVLDASPQSAEAHYLMGLALLEGRKPQDAITAFQKSLKTERRNPSALTALGRAWLATGNYEAALEALNSALKAQTGFHRALIARAEAYLHIGDFGAAIADYGSVLLKDPTDAHAFHNRGFACYRLGRFGDAVANFSRAIALKPDYVEAFNNRGNSLQEIGRSEDAIADYEAVIRLRPMHPNAHSNRANALVSIGKVEEAIASAQKGTEVTPNSAVAWNNLGYALQQAGRHREAIPHLEASVGLNPGYAEAHNNLAHSYHKSLRIAAALGSYERAIALKPGYAEAIWNRGLIKLLSGDLPSGFSDIEWRWRCKGFHKHPRSGLVPEWHGEPLAGRSILLHAEQGYGDTFNFCRYIPLLQKAGAEVAFAAPQTVHRLLSTLGPDVRIQQRSTPERPTHFECALMSLPDRFQTTLQTIPRNVPYLFAEKELVERWHTRIGSHGFKVGISWQGNPQGSVDIGRSMPLAELAPLSRIPGVRLISIQVKNGLEQLASLPSGMSVETLDDFNAGPDGFIDTAAVMHCLDLVLTTDSAPAHLAGALGVPVWTMLMEVPDWRYFLNRDDSPWYPTMRLFRQRTSGDWTELVERVRIALLELQGVEGPHA